MSAPGGSVTSRFVSQTELEEAKQARLETYKRIGKTPPPAEEYDPRSLYERLQASKQAKQDEYDEAHKLSNQFRGIDEDESAFLADVERAKRTHELAQRRAEALELDQFRRRATETEPHDIAKNVPPPPKVQSQSKKKRKATPGGALGIVRKKPTTDKAKLQQQPAETKADSQSTLDKSKSTAEPAADKAES